MTSVIPTGHNGVDRRLLQNIEEVINGKKLGLMVEKQSLSATPAGQSTTFAPSAMLCEIAATSNSPVVIFLLLIPHG